MKHRTPRIGWLALSLVCAATSLYCPARAAQTDGPPCQPQWVSMFSGPNALNGPVYALLIHDFGDGPALYVGGSFTMAGSQVVNRVAKWDLTEAGGWSPMGEGIAAAVNCLAVFDDGTNGPQLYAGGNFFEGVKKWNGSQWQAIVPGLESAWVSSFTVFDTGTGPALYIGGLFYGQYDFLTFLRWVGATMTPANLWGYGKGGDVWASAVYDDGTGASMYVSGGFATTDAPAAFAQGNGSEWKSLWTAGYVGPLAVHDDGSGPGLYAGCTVAQGTSYLANGVAKWTGNTWAQLGTGFTGTCLDYSCINSCGGQAPGGCWCDEACCGFFDCCFDADTFCVWCWPVFGPRCAINALATFDEETDGGPVLYAAGAFSSIDNVEVNNIAKWDGTQWNAVGEGVGQVDLSNSSVRALAAYQPTNGDPPILFAGGNFTNTLIGDKYLVAYVGCPTRPQCAAADINCDGVVNVADLLSVINAWGACQPRRRNAPLTSPRRPMAMARSTLPICS